MRKKIVVAMLVAFAMWPLVHFVLCETVGINPWKYGGWAMYTTARRTPLVSLYVNYGTGLEPIEVDDLSERTRMSIYGFMIQRSVERVGSDPEPVAKLIFSELERPAIIVRFDVGDFSLDPETARVQMETTVYTYRRSELGVD